MRVLLSCLQSQKRHALPAYDFWRTYFVEGCREAGVECIEVPGVDWAEAMALPQGEKLDLWRTRTWDSTLEFARKERSNRDIDFFLGYLYPRQVEEGAIVELQRMGIPCVNFFCDNVREFDTVPEEYRQFDLHWVPEFEALPMYRHAGQPHIHAPMPCWVPPDLRTPPQLETEPPTFIGSADILRRSFLGRAVSAGADLVVRGAGWGTATDVGCVPKPKSSAAAFFANQVQTARAHGLLALYRKMQNAVFPLDIQDLRDERVRPFVTQDEYIRITREAIVTIGINRVPTARRSHRNPLTYSRLRDIEAPMLGACYLTEWTAGLEQLYDIGVEIESYRTAEELSFKILELKNDRPRRMRMRKEAQRRALHEHSVARSLQKICKRLGIRGAE